MTPQQTERFWSKVVPRGECLVWIGGTNSRGYGCFGIGGGITKLVHRLALVLAGRDIPADMTVDHLCRNKLCVRVEHLEVVSRLENVKRQMRAASPA